MAEYEKTIAQMIGKEEGGILFCLFVCLFFVVVLF